MWKLLKRWRSALSLSLALLLALLVWNAPWRVRKASEAEAGRAASLLVESPARFTRLLRESVSRLRSLWDAEERARKLEEELSLLRLEYRQLEESYERAARRGHILDFGKRYLNKLIPANLLARDPGTWFHVILLDKGKDDGVSVGAGVLNAQGVVGKVLSVQSGSCKVVFITDAACRLSVRSARSRVLAILSGDGRKAARLEYVSGKDDIVVGDLIETAPGSISFASGIPCGTVSRVMKIDNGLKLAVEVQPSAELNRLEGLYISGQAPGAAPPAGTTR